MPAGQTVLVSQFVFSRHFGPFVAENKSSRKEADQSQAGKAKAKCDGVERAVNELYN